MKFGKVDQPELVDFTLPPTHPDTIALLQQHKTDHPLDIYVGCAKWNRTDLKGFYPRGTKDELAYYSTQFNSIELNATFYNSPGKEQVETWRDKTPEGFKFFPKIPQSISHFSRLLNSTEKTLAFCDSIVLFEDKLGTAFLQLKEDFKPKDIDRLAAYVRDFPQGVPLAVEVRHEQWFSDPEAQKDLYAVFRECGICNIVVDTAGRRDMLHMHLTTPTAFVRYVGANHKSDYSRLDEWVSKVKEWKDAGLQSLYFFIHQNVEEASPLLAAYFIEKLNKALEINMTIPQGVTSTSKKTGGASDQSSLPL